jgi:hypothetical protein
MENLTTACFDCNNGKSAVPLTSIPLTVEQMAVLRKEKLLQVKVLQWLIYNEQCSVFDSVSMVSDEWMRSIGANPKKYQITDEAWTAATRFLDRLPLEKVMEAARAIWKVSHKSADVQFRYFCGICWNFIREQEETA